MNIVITGGTRGIRFGLVSEFLKKGHTVTFSGTSKNSIQSAKSKLTGNCQGVICDVRNQEELNQLLYKSLESYGNIDIWVNNAGVDHPRLDVSDLNEIDFRKVIDINVVGMMIGTSIALKQMKKQNYGHVYNMEGLGSNNMMIPKTLIYGSSKRLVTYFSRGCNKELKNHKQIFVGTVSPGMVFTDLLNNNLGEDGNKIAHILGNKVEEVTPFLVKKMLKGKQYIYWLTNMKVMKKFLFSIFKK